MIAVKIPAAFQVLTGHQFLEDDERDCILDTFYRFGAGQDLSERSLMGSAFSVDAVLDFSQPARVFGAEIAPFAGRERIVSNISLALDGLATTHSFSNPRVTRADRSALVQVLCEAQHVRISDGVRLLLKNWYWCSLVKEGGLWVFEEVVIQNVWYEGLGDVLFPKE